MKYFFTGFKLYLSNTIFSLVFFVVIVFLPTTEIYAQYSSADNNSGSWEAPISWVYTVAPPASINKSDVRIYGEITANQCLDFNLSTLSVYDTLIIHGNLELKNTSSLLVKNGAVLIILGDYLTKNKVDVINDGTIIIVGRFAMQGASDKGGFINNGNLYLYDTIPEIKTGESYASISCLVDNVGEEICGFKDSFDLSDDEIFSYFNELPFNLDLISIEGNLCQLPDASIFIDKVDLCIGEVFTVYTDSINVEFNQNMTWDFGTDAIPRTQKNIGPHEVYYTSSGEKNISLVNSADSSVIQRQLINVHDSPLSTLYMSINGTDIAYSSFRDNICPNDIVLMHINGAENNLFQWLIPELDIDTICNSSLEIHWNILSGEYRVSISEISSEGCAGEPLNVDIFINECANDKIFTDEYYAFTPNSDGINDFWEIENIENYPLARILVFDRNGKMVFSSEGYYKNDWDGTIDDQVLDLNSYFFIIDFSAYQKNTVRGVLTILHE